MGQAIHANYTITTSSESQEKERLRAKARHDETQTLYNVRRICHDEGQAEGKHEIARNLIGMGLSLTQVVDATGLNCEEVE